MSLARDDMLHRIKLALQDVPGKERPEDVPVIREYRQAGASAREELVERFADRLVDYKAKVARVAEAALPGAIAAACAARGVRRLVAPADLPESWTPAEVELLRDTGGELSNLQLDESDGVLTACALGIAQTGTIVLDGGPAQGRRVLTLLPDYHLCVIRAEQIVELVPEAITRLGPAVREERRPITMISGPSATSDIELNRVEGVHGPRTLEVLIVVPSE
ncbi:MAG TPA: LUD domain-containing protein [Roseiflexaceae bacterium]|nr:LUD domain-containing protein [Roseiflexaceae bacterium]